MRYAIDEAKELVVKAGKMLVESGLIARTWGNISARISDTEFVITPSGLAYETLTPKDIVIVNILDCSYEGEIKPSSEKGVHADIYRLRKDIDFVIHTHQKRASVISIMGENIQVDNERQQKVLGKIVPCAAYGISSTKKLRKEVADVVSRYPDSKAVLMKHHGTVCMGNGLEHCFEIARTLEQLCIESYIQACQSDSNQEKQIIDLGKSERIGDIFKIKCNNQTTEYKLNALPKDAPMEAKLHAAIYKKSKVNCIIHSTKDEIVRLSSTNHVLKPYLDDLAQIAGINIKTIKIDKVKRVQRELKHKNAVLLSQAGALCTGITIEDAKAVEIVLSKGCEAQLYCNAVNHKKSLGLLDAYLQRIVYVLKYSKQKIRGDNKEECLKN